MTDTERISWLEKNQGCSVEHKEWDTSEPQAEKDRKCSPGLCAGCTITRDDFDNPNAVCNHER